MHKHHYARLAIMTALSFGAMYGLMYAMVNSWSNVLANSNQIYMAGLMVASMVVIELAVMGPMYQSKRLNLLIYLISALALAVFWIAIREQAGIGDRQFLRSMIPHHAGAILMCENADIHDQEIRKLCQTIISGQRAEIDQMKGLLERQSR